MFERFLEFIKQIFKRDKSITSSKQGAENQTYNDEYTDISKINFTSIFANKLSTLAISDSTASIAEDNARCEILNKALDDVWNNIKKIVSAALGCGGCVIAPYVKDGAIYYNTIKQNRLIINEKSGDKIISATIIADSVIIKNQLYYRLVDYTVEGDNLYIMSRAINEYGSRADVEMWRDIQDIAISGVDRVLFGYIKSPADNYKTSNEYGVPITYGCKPIIDEILECLEQIRKEFKLKKVRLQVDERTLDKDPKTGKPILKDDLFIKGTSETGDLFNIYNPDIRESSFYTRLNELFRLLEQKVGTSKGILTAPESYGATATEIRAAMADTFAIITDVRKAVESGLRDFIYACDVLANYYNLSPIGDYEINYDWSYQLLESSTETFAQMKDLQSVGAMSKAELRQYVTGEGLEEAQKAVDDITSKEPSLSSVLGMSE